MTSVWPNIESINWEQTQKKIKREWMPTLFIFTGIAVKAIHFNRATRMTTMDITPKRYSFFSLLRYK